MEKIKTILGKSNTVTDKKQMLQAKIIIILKLMKNEHPKTLLLN